MEHRNMILIKKFVKLLLLSSGKLAEYANKKIYFLIKAELQNKLNLLILYEEWHLKDI